jgi:hypothetical protein
LGNGALAANIPIVQIPVSGNGTATVTWEVVNASTTFADQIRFGIVLAANGGVVTPTQVIATVNCTVAPVNPNPPGVGTAVPRFVDTSSSLQAFSVGP